MEVQEMKDVAESLRKAANSLFTGPCRDVRDGDPCLERQVSSTRGKYIVLFRDYDPNKMCGDCRRYWFAEMAAQETWEAYCWKARGEATK